jgi:hypothetical protein
MPLIASRWFSQPQTMATRRGFFKWPKHGGISPSWRRPKPHETTKITDANAITADRNGITSTAQPAPLPKSGTWLSSVNLAEQVLVPVLRHPFCPREVAVPCPPSPLRLAHRIDVHHDARNLPPDCTFAVRIKVTRCSSSYAVNTPASGALSATGGSSGGIISCLHLSAVAPDASQPAAFWRRLPHMRLARHPIPTDDTF